MIVHLAFADGHAENHKWIDSKTIKAAQDSANGKIASFGGEGMQRTPTSSGFMERYRHKKYKPI